MERRERARRDLALLADLRPLAHDLDGVVDHLVTLANGQQVHNALRVVPNGDGAEVMFTLLRLPGMSDAQFAEDAAWVEKDLASLKSILESSKA